MPLNLKSLGRIAFTQIGIGKVFYTNPNKLELQSRTSAQATSAQGKLIGQLCCTDLTFPGP